MKRIDLMCILSGIMLFSVPVEAKLFKIVGIQEKSGFLDQPAVSEDLPKIREEPFYFIDAGREQGMELGTVLNVYRYIYADDPTDESPMRVKLLIGTLEVITPDEKTSLTKVVSKEPMKKLTLDFYRFMVGDAVAPSLKLDSAVMFSPGSVQLTAGATQELEKAATQIKAIEPKKIVIEGHTDNTGDPKINYQLSLQRAENVKAFFVSQGISEDVIKAVGYGDTRPVAPNDTVKNQQKNRRIEVVFWE